MQHHCTALANRLWQTPEHIKSPVSPPQCQACAGREGISRVSPLDSTRQRLISPWDTSEVPAPPLQLSPGPFLTVWLPGPTSWSLKSCAYLELVIFFQLHLPSPSVLCQHNRGWIPLPGIWALSAASSGAELSLVPRSWCKERKRRINHKWDTGTGIVWEQRCCSLFCGDQANSRSSSWGWGHQGLVPQAPDPVRSLVPWPVTALSLGQQSPPVSSTTRGRGRNKVVFPKELASSCGWEWFSPLCSLHHCVIYIHWGARTAQSPLNISN